MESALICVETVSYFVEMQAFYVYGGEGRFFVTNVNIREDIRPSI